MPPAKLVEVEKAVHIPVEVIVEKIVERIVEVEVPFERRGPSSLSPFPLFQSTLNKLPGWGFSGLTERGQCNVTVHLLFESEAVSQRQWGEGYLCVSK